MQQHDVLRLHVAYDQQQCDQFPTSSSCADLNKYAAQNHNQYQNRKLVGTIRVLWVYLCHSCATTGIADKLWLRLIAPPQQQPEATLISRTLASSILNLNLCAWTGPGHSKLFDNAYSKRKKHKKKPNLSELKPQINIVLCALLKFEFQMSHATGKIYFSFFFSELRWEFLYTKLFGLWHAHIWKPFDFCSLTFKCN